MKPREIILQLFVDLANIKKDENSVIITEIERKLRLLDKFIAKGNALTREFIWSKENDVKPMQNLFNFWVDNCYEDIKRD